MLKCSTRWTRSQTHTVEENRESALWCPLLHRVFQWVFIRQLPLYTVQCVPIVFHGLGHQDSKRWSVPRPVRWRGEGAGSGAKGQCYGGRGRAASWSDGTGHGQEESHGRSTGPRSHRREIYQESVRAAQFFLEREEKINFSKKKFFSPKSILEDEEAASSKETVQKKTKAIAGGSQFGNFSGW